MVSRVWAVMAGFKAQAWQPWTTPPTGALPHPNFCFLGQGPQPPAVVTLYAPSSSAAVSCGCATRLDLGRLLWSEAPRCPAGAAPVAGPRRVCRVRLLGARPSGEMQAVLGRAEPGGTACHAPTELLAEGAVKQSCSASPDCTPSVACI